MYSGRVKKSSKVAVMMPRVMVSERFLTLLAFLMRFLVMWRGRKSLVDCSFFLVFLLK